jgi:hypothetical protein
MTRDLTDLTTSELLSYAADHAALANSAKAELRTRALARRVRLADFIKEHRETFIDFFAMGGCKRPEEAVDSLTEHPEEYRPMAYAMKEPL